MGRRRVVVTGLGLVTPLGVGRELNWTRLLEGHTGVSEITRFDASHLPVQIAAQVPGDVENLPAVQRSVRFRDTPRFIQYALQAADEALDDARWKPTNIEEQRRTGSAIGVGIGSLQDVVDAQRHVASGPRGFRKITPHFVPRVLVNMAAGAISIEHGLKGPSHSSTTACAAASHAIADAARLIACGEVDVMVCGGSESCIQELAIVGFAKIRALAQVSHGLGLSTTADETEAIRRASRPFDRDRSGFVMGEGAGVLVLEEMKHAQKRGANVYAELRGWGSSCDAHHITAPAPDGEGARSAMIAALQSAGCETHDIGYINAHATSTPLGDKVEAAVIAQLFPHGPWVSSTKGATGHLLGAAGAVEAIFTVLALQQRRIPSNVNWSNPDPDCSAIRLATPQTAPAASDAAAINLNAAMSNSFGFGGTNSALLFSTL